MPTTVSHGCELRYEVIDLVAPWVEEPETILFNHGLGSGAAAWAEWLPALVDRYRIVRFDLRGHHGSKKGAEDQPVSFGMLCDDSIAVADAAGLDRFHFVGESVGGTIGLMLGISHPERLLTVTASNAAHRGEAIESIEPFRNYIAEQGMAGWSRDMMPKRFPVGTLDAQVARWYEAQQADLSPSMFLDTVAALVEVDLSPDLPKIAAPVLLLQGDHSPFIPVGVTCELAALVPNVRLQIFAHARHGLPVSHARPSAAVLRAFLDSWREQGRVPA